MSDQNIFTSRVRVVVFGVGIVSLIASVLGIVFGTEWADPPPQAHDSFGRGALGHRAFVETMNAMGVHALRWTRADYARVSAPLFFIEPNAATLERRGTRIELRGLIEDRMHQGRKTVLVLSKWRPSGPFGEALFDPDFERIGSHLPLGAASEHGSGKWSSIATFENDGTQRSLELRAPVRFASNSGAMVHLSDEEGRAYVISDPDRLFFLVSDPDLLHSYSLDRGDHADFWFDFIRQTLHSDTIVVDEVFHGARDTRSLARVFGRWPGILALLHLSLIVFVVLAMGRKRFGPPRAPRTPYGRGPSESIGVAASLLRLGSNPSTMIRAYIDDVFADLARTLDLRAGASSDERARAIDELATRRSEPIRASELLQKATDAPDLDVARRAAELRHKLLAAQTRKATR